MNATRSQTRVLKFRTDYQRFLVYASLFLALSVVFGQGTGVPKPKKRTAPVPTTFRESSAKQVSINGRSYGVQEALAQLPIVLSSTNSHLKLQWLYAVSLFRTNLNSNVVTSLAHRFRTEPNARVREALLHPILFSGDSRFDSICVSGKKDEDPVIRLGAGAILLKHNRVEGLEVVTGCLPELNDRCRQLAVNMLRDAVPEFGLDYEDTSAEVPGPTRAKVDAFIRSWTKWWAKNKSSVLNASKDRESVMSVDRKANKAK